MIILFSEYVVRVINLSLILFNISFGIYSIPKESKYAAVFLLINNETQCVPLLCLSLRFVTYILISILLKGYSGTKNFPRSIMTPLPVMPFTTEEITGCTTEGAKSAKKAARNPLSCFFIYCFTASVTQSINTSEYFNDFTILIILSKSSFEINKVNPFPALTALFPLSFKVILHLKLHLKLYCLLIQLIYL